MRPSIKGLSHGLKIARQLSIFTPACGLVPPFRVRPEHQKTGSTIWYTGRDSFTFSFLWNENRGVAVGQPPASNSPPDYCIDLSSPFSNKRKKTRYPMGIWSFWYTGRDSNPQPSEPESDALSIEPPVHLLKAYVLYQAFVNL